MLDLVTAQDDLRLVLLSAESLATINVRSYRAMRVASETNWRTIIERPRTTKVGAGVLVLMPEAMERHSNVPGPVLDWSFGVVCIENPVLNMNASVGTLVSAEEIAQRVMDVLHLHADDLLGTFKLEGRAFAPEREFTFKGCLAYRVTLTLVGRSIQTARPATLAFAYAGGSLAITCATPGASVQYTLDGTFPAAAGAGNTASTTYTAPFAVQAGAVVRAAAYKAGLNASEVRRYAVT